MPSVPAQRGTSRGERGEGIAATARGYPRGVGFTPMPLRSYGVLKATILDRRLATDRTDHYMLQCGVGTTRYTVAINAHSDAPPGDVEYAVFRATGHPLAKRLDA